MAGIDATRLPPLVSSEAIVGSITPDAAAALGIPAGVPVARRHQRQPRGRDRHRRVPAGDDRRDDRHHERDARHHRPARHRPRPRGPLDAEPARRRVPRVGRERARRQGARARARPHRARDRRARRPRDRRPVRASSTARSRACRPGSGGVLFLPWLAGSLSPRSDGHVRGGFLNLSLDTHRTDLVRAVIEGICHNLGWLLPVVERFTGQPAEFVTSVAARPARPSGCRPSPTSSTGPSARCRTRTRPSPAAPRCSRSTASARSRRPTIVRPSTSRHGVEAQPSTATDLRRDAGAVRRRVRSPPTHLRRPQRLTRPTADPSARLRS